MSGEPLNGNTASTALLELTLAEGVIPIVDSPRLSEPEDAR
jgi:hypothetical protein